jgi:hypothetical protein
MTLASAWPGFIVKIRQQPFEACVATRSNFMSIGLAPGLDNGSGSSSVADEVQAWSDTASPNRR